jgi:hypothetical protein
VNAVEGRSANGTFGSPDDLEFRSSTAFFDTVAEDPIPFRTRSRYPTTNPTIRLLVGARTLADEIGDPEGTPSVRTSGTADVSVRDDGVIVSRTGPALLTAKRT